MFAATEFEKIPPLFVELYRYQFEVWAREYRKRGPKCAIVFARRPGSAVLLDAGGRPIQAGAWLTAELDVVGTHCRFVVRPATDHDAEMIERHCLEMRGQALQ